MKDFKKKILTVAVVALALMMALPTAVSAHGKIDTTEDAVSLTIHYKDGTTPIEGARFDIYKVADVDEFGYLTICDDFKSYPIDFAEMLSNSGNSHEEIQQHWMDLALTLKGYAKADDLNSTTVFIDENGDASLDLTAGLYLIAGAPRTIDEVTYFATPYMIHLPGLTDADEWYYDVETNVKNGKDTDSDRYVTRKAIKVWDDEGYETLRPESVTVDLMYDSEEESGVVADTQDLNADNNWQFAWDNLDAKNDWYVVEHFVDGYTVKINAETATINEEGKEGSVTVFTVKNKFIEPVNITNPPIVKKITVMKGSTTPKKDVTFIFYFRGIFTDATDKEGQILEVPMPEGSEDLTKTLEITGAGIVEAGEITFQREGTYIYQINEEQGTISGYKFDDTVYTLIYTVQLVGEDLEVTREIYTNFELDDPSLTDGTFRDVLAALEEEAAEEGGEEIEVPIEPELPDDVPEGDVILFDNEFKILPHTGIYWWPVPVMLAGGAIFIIIGVMRRRSSNVA